MKLIAIAAAASSLPGFFLGVPEAACSFLTLTLAIYVLVTRGASP